MLRNTPKATVAALITRGAGARREILLTRRAVAPYRGRWALPGGHIEADEAAEDALKREILEEVGLAIEPRFVGYRDEIVVRRGIHAVVLVFTATAADEPRALDEVAELAWMTPAEALARPLAFRHRDVVAAFAMPEAS